MSSSHDDALWGFGELRSLVQQPPSEQVWATLCEHVERLSAPAMRDLLPYLTHALDRWPVRLRSAPASWLERVVTSCEPLPQLALTRVLQLTGRRPLTPSQLDALVESAALAHVAHLEVRGPVLGRGALGALIARAPMPRLQSWKSIKSDIFINDFSGLLLGGERAWRSLSFSREYTIAHLIEALVGAPTMGALEQLEIIDSHLRPDALRLVARSSLKLTSLCVDYNLESDPPAWLREMMRSMDSLTRFSARANGLRDRDVADALSESLADREQGGPSLDSLDLAHNDLGASSAATIASAAWSAHLARLNLSHNQLGERGGRSIARGVYFSKLKYIGLRGCGLGDEAACALAEPVSIGEALRTLDVGGNEIGERGRRALRTRYAPEMLIAEGEG